MGYIKNYDSLATNDQRKLIIELVETAFASVAPQEVFKNDFAFENKILKIKDQTFDLNNFDRVFLVGFGKGSAGNAKILEEKLENPIHFPVPLLKIFHGFLDHYNYILDREFGAIKQILYPDYWKILQQSLFLSFIHLPEATYNCLADDVKGECDHEQEQPKSKNTVVVDRVIAEVTAGNPYDVSGNCLGADEWTKRKVGPRTGGNSNDHGFTDCPRDAHDDRGGDSHQQRDVATVAIVRDRRKDNRPGLAVSLYPPGDEFAGLAQCVGGRQRNGIERIAILQGFGHNLAERPMLAGQAVLFDAFGSE